MKVKTEQQAPAFQPVTITITLESEREARSFSTMMAMNTSIPQLLVDKGCIESGEQVAELVEIMRGVYQSMGKV